MEVKPGYKQTEMGVIPEEWEVKPFTKVTDLITCGIAATPAYVPESQGYPFLSSSNVKEGRIVWSGYKYISTELHRQLYRNNPPKRGDILYSRVGTFGEAAVVDTDSEFSVYVSLTLIKPVKTLDSWFLMQLLNSNAYKQRAKDQVYLGGGVGNLNVDVVRRYPIVVPPFTEQRAIAAALSDVDSLLGGLDRLIAKKRDLKQAAMQQLLTGQTRLPGFSGAWETKRLGDQIIRLRKTNRPSGSGKSEGKYPFFTNSTKPCDKYLDEFDFDTEAIIANTGGEAFFNYFKGPFAAMADCLVLESRVVTRLVYFLLKTTEQHINDTGFTGSGIKHLDKRYFSDFELRLPPTANEQTAIAAVLSDMDAELAALEARRDKTLDLKQAMMQELLTGRTRLA